MGYHAEGAHASLSRRKEREGGREGGALHMYLMPYDGWRVWLGRGGGRKGGRKAK